MCERVRERELEREREKEREVERRRENERERKRGREREREWESKREQLEDNQSLIFLGYYIKWNGKVKLLYFSCSFVFEERE